MDVRPQSASGWNGEGQRSILAGYEASVARPMSAIVRGWRGGFGEVVGEGVGKGKAHLVADRGVAEGEGGKEGEFELEWRGAEASRGVGSWGQPGGVVVRDVTRYTRGSTRPLSALDRTEGGDWSVGRGASAAQEVNEQDRGLQEGSGEVLGGHMAPFDPNATTQVVSVLSLTLTISQPKTHYLSA